MLSGELKSWGHKKSPRCKAGAFHPLEWYDDSIGCWLGVKNPGLLFLDDDPLDGLFAGFRVGHFDGVDTRFLNIEFVIGIGDVA